MGRPPIVVKCFILVLFGPMLSPYAIDQTDWYQISTAPNLINGHIFGTDDLGRDLFVTFCF